MSHKQPVQVSNNGALNGHLYHITHIDNLQSILQDGGLRSDAAMVARGGPAATIGMSSIKARRLRLPVKCYPGDRVGDYVPFYRLCNRGTEYLPPPTCG